MTEGPDSSEDQGAGNRGPRRDPSLLYSIVPLGTMVLSIGGATGGRPRTVPGEP